MWTTERLALVVLAGCSGGPTPDRGSGKEDDGGTDPVEDTASVDTETEETDEPATGGAIVAPLAHAVRGSWAGRIGSGLGQTGGSLVFGVPGEGQHSGDWLAYSRVNLARPPFGELQSWEMNTTLYGLWYPAELTTLNSELGTEITLPGDLTGDGLADLVSFDGSADAFLGAPAFLYPGPLEDRGNWDTLTTEIPTKAIPLDGVGVPWRGAPCGDVNGDDATDLCLGTGVVFGPVTEGAALDVTWSAAGPSESVRLAGIVREIQGKYGFEPDHDLLLWDAAAHAVRWITKFPAGELDLGQAEATWTAPAGKGEAFAVGDLDGDADEDFAFAWTGEDGPVVYLVTDTDGGDLADAWATLTLPAAKKAPEFVPACARPAEMCATVALAVGDLDGDGAADLAVGWDSEVRVFRGPFPAGEIPLDAATHWLRGHSDADQFGHALLIGDVTLDGTPDLVVGAPDDWQHTGVPPGGAVYVLAELFAE